ncbi:MAG: nickel pincer cofactor biosynthesis protein LarB [Ignavibacteria bacterium]|nr:nickel pincer cofactor biosynthesis protein LarB [Ignavibacteria bacterium]
MDQKQLKKLLRQYRTGTRGDEELLTLLASHFSESVGFATIDHHREYRQGFPEVILCEGKTPKQVTEIAQRIVRHGSVLLATRATGKHYAAVRRHLSRAKYDEVGRTITANEHLVKPAGRGMILVVTAGTSDIPVAEEACTTARLMGNQVDRIFDVGVAGIHRILAHSEKLRNASVIVVVAGMEGALASVVGGLVRVPVIAVPTSIGYGASFGGVAALLGMLNSCAAGVTVVNIDNGFGAGFAASLINRST